MNMKFTEKFVVVSKVVDILVNVLIISPLVIFYWRGTWEIFDVYIYPDNLEFSAWTCFGIGNTIIIIFSLLQGVLDSNLKNIFGVRRLLITRLYIYIYAFGCVNQWRGIWFIIDHYTGKTWESCVVSIAVSFCSLTALRNFISVVASPLILAFDEDRADFFAINGLLTTQPGCNLRFVFNASCCVICINNLVVTFWRGVWTFADIFLEPSDIFTSGLYSICISCGLVVPVLFLEKSVKKLSNKLDGNYVIFRILLEAIYLFISSLVPILHWRGFWLLQDAKLFPHDKYLSVWISHVIGFFGLSVFLASRSVTTASCTSDTNIHKLDVTLYKMSYIKKVYQVIRNHRMRSYDLNNQSKKHSNKRELPVLDHI